MLGKGAYGLVGLYEKKDVKYAIKLENSQQPFKSLLQESINLRKINERRNAGPYSEFDHEIQIPRYHDHGYVQSSQETS